MSRTRTPLALALALAGFAPALAQSVTLADAVRQAVATHPDVSAANDGASAADDALREAIGARGPQVDLRAAIGRERSENPATRALNSDHESLTRGESRIVVQQFLVDGGTVTNRIRQFDRLADAEESRVDDVKLLLSLRAVQSYLEVLHQREQVALAKANVANKKKYLERVGSRQRGGVGVSSDVEQARARVALAESQAIARQGALEGAEAAYREAVGAEPGTLKVPEIPEAKLPGTVEEALTRIPQGHPAYKRAQLAAEAARYAAESGHALMNPRVDLELSAGRNNDLDGVRGRNEDVSAMVVATWSIASGGTRQATRDRLVAQRAQAEGQRDALRRRLERDLKIGWIRYKTAKGNQARLEENAKLDAEVVDAFEQQWGLGRRTLFDLLNADDSLYRSGSAALAAQYEAFFGVYEVLAGMGSLLAEVGGAGEEGD